MRSRLGAASTILLFHIISARPSKQPRMVGSTLGVYSFGLIFVSARTNKRHHHHPVIGVLFLKATVLYEPLLLRSYSLCRSCLRLMPVYVCVCFDVCAAASFDARRLLCQAMRSDMCSFSCRRIKESSKWESGFLIPVYIQQSTT